MPISSCRCGLPSPNASWVVAPDEVVQLDCKNWYGCPLVAKQGMGSFRWEAWDRSGWRALAGSKGSVPLHLCP